MSEASVEACYMSNAKVGHAAQKAGGVPVSFGCVETRGENTFRQHAGVPTLSAGRSPHGVKSGPNAGKGKLSEPGNSRVTSFGMAEATGDRRARGHSLHSSPRAGKPSTWQREAGMQQTSRREV